MTNPFLRHKLPLATPIRILCSVVEWNGLRARAKRCGRPENATGGALAPPAVAYEAAHATECALEKQDIRGLASAMTGVHLGPAQRDAEHDKSRHGPDQIEGLRIRHFIPPSRPKPGLVAFRDAKGDRSARAPTLSQINDGRIGRFARLAALTENAGG